MVERHVIQNVRFSVIFAKERKEDLTKMPGECPPRNVLGSSRMAHLPDCSWCEADITWCEADR